jgi:hypothetical protein
LEQTKKESNHLQLVVDTSSANYNNLKLREEAGLDGKIIAELVDGTTIWTNKEQLDFDNSLEENDGHKWLRVELTDGQSGYVAMDYVKEKQQEKKEETKTKSDSTVTINFAPKSSEYEDNQTGYLGIDVDIITDAAAFEELLKNGVDYSKSDWVSNNDKKIPNFVYLKCGASNFTSRKINTTQSSKTIEYRNNLERLVKLCEQYKIPYGFYYFSQAINEQDIKTEANFIKKELNDYNTTYNILPFAIDIEEQAKEGDISYYTRVHNNAQNKGKNYQTNITNELINRVREENPNFDFILYTDHNTLASSLNYSEFDEKNKQNPWIVDSTKTHAENLATHDKAAISNASIRQIAIEKKDPDSGIKIDMDFIDKEYFEKILKDHGFEISKKDKDQKLASNNNDYKYTYKPNNDVLLPSGGHLKYKDGEYIVIPPEKETNKSKTLSLS